MYRSSDGARVYDGQLNAAEASSLGPGSERSILFSGMDLLFTAGSRKSSAEFLTGGPAETSGQPDSFRDGRRYNIAAPDGASISGESIEGSAGPDPPMRYAQATGGAAVQVPIGRVEKVSGSVTVLRNGTIIELRLGDMVAKGDVVQTGPASSLTVKLNDGTVFHLSSSARMVLNDMVYVAGSDANSALFTLVQGLIGFVAGQVAKTGDLKVETPVATMAIRGTAVQTEIAALSGVTRFSLLTEPDGTVGSIVLLDKTNQSRVLVSISDARVSTVLTPVAGSDPAITQIAKTNDEIRSESDFVRDLFQFVSGTPQRRGSSEPEDTLIVPASLPEPIDFPDNSQLIFVPFLRPSVDPREMVIPDPIVAPAPIRGTAIEDGPLERLDALPSGVTSGSGAQPVVLVPASLPPGVQFLAASQSFSLDPTHPAYQHLGVGETQTVTVAYRLDFGNGTIVPASVRWVVDGRNDAPVADNDQILELSEAGRTILRVLSNDRDIDGDMLRVTRWTSPIEGSVSLDANGNLVFDPGNDFSALSDGETATVSFAYTISDGHGGSDTAEVTLQVQGRGVFSAPVQSASDTDVLDFNDQPVSLTVRTPSATTTAQANLELIVAQGAVVQPQMNILYLIDVSGSTSDRFDGTPVGDLNGDGRANTILDAEIASLMALTEKVRALGFSPADVSVTIIPFNESADPTDARNPDLDGVNAATFSLGQAGDEAIESYLRNLDEGGETNFANALRAAGERLQSLDQGGEKNVLYFLSDGAGQGDIDAEVAALTSRFDVRIAALGIGEDTSLSQLNRIDNTGGAARLTSPDQIDVSDVGMPLQSGRIADVDVFVNGREIVDIGPDDLILVGNTWVLNTSVDGLNRLVGNRNEVSAIVTFESGEVLTAELNIAGALPRSTDFVI